MRAREACRSQQDGVQVENHAVDTLKYVDLLSLAGKRLNFGTFVIAGPPTDVGHQLPSSLESS